MFFFFLEIHDIDWLAVLTACVIFPISQKFGFPDTPLPGSFWEGLIGAFPPLLLFQGA